MACYGTDVNLRFTKRTFLKGSYTLLLKVTEVFCSKNYGARPRRGEEKKKKKIKKKKYCSRNKWISTISKGNNKWPRHQSAGQNNSSTSKKQILKNGCGIWSLKLSKTPKEKKGFFFVFLGKVLILFSHNGGFWHPKVIILSH